ncbi:hypothetical protein ACFLZW_04415 [Chloroflexota bacterium]
MLTNLDKAKKFGYWFNAPETVHAPGGNRLDIVLNESPTKGKIGARSVDLSVKSGEDSIVSIRIQHPWPFERTYQVCAGLVEIFNDKGEPFEALTLGGQLHLDTQEEFTACTLESPAPILLITDARPIEMLFVDEIKILLAELRAERLAEPHSFEIRLINAHPLVLYISLIDALVEKMEQSHHKENSQVIQLINFVHAERKRLLEQRLAPSYVPALEEIL